jgi:AraC-like DNA-binding protein/ligand-binding sensor protein
MAEADHETLPEGGEFDLHAILEAYELLADFGIAFHNVRRCPRVSHADTPVQAEGLEPQRIHLSPFCEQLKTTTAGLKACVTCDQDDANALVGRVARPLRHRCHAGLEEVLVPVMCEGRHIGTLFGGQARPRSLDEPALSTLRRHWQELGLDADRQQELLDERPAADPRRLRALARALALLAGVIAARAATRTIQLALEARRNAPIERALRFMVENIERDFALSEVARHVHLSPSRLSHLFTRHQGHSFRETLLRLRIERAEQLLSTTELPVQEIALRVGYADPDFFCRIYKRIRQRTPGQYRRQTRSP